MPARGSGIRDEEAESRARLGSPAQRARISSYLSTDGHDSGMRVIRVRTASGLDLDLLPDRGLDIGYAGYRGTVLSWLSTAGFGAFPRSPRDDDWLTAFGGGLLTTCGPNTFGRASEWAGRRYPTHGMQSGLVMEIVEKTVTWSEARVVATGTMSSLFDDEWDLVRTVTVGNEAADLAVHDRVTNRASRSAGHMVLYHFNFGWPVIGGGLLVDSGASRIVAMGPQRRSRGSWRTMSPPDPNAEEAVYHHVFTTQPWVSLRRGPAGLKVRVSASANLGHMFQWIYTRSGKYVMGIEPASSGTLGGRADAESRHDIREVEPGASAEFRVELSISSSTRLARDAHTGSREHKY